MKRTSHETDGKFAITTFTAVKKFEKSASDRNAWLDVCDNYGVDGEIFAAPAGFAGWDYSAKAARVVSMFSLAPVTVTMPVSVEVNA